MDEEVSLARQEREGRSMLLAGSGSGLSGNKDVHGDEGKEVAGNAKGRKGGKNKTASSKSKGDAKAKSGNRRGRKRGRTYSLRESARTTEGANRPSGRSAKELGITWLDARCDKSPKTRVHWFIGRMNTDNGTVFQCKFCHRVKWLPNTIQECERLGNWMRVYGEDGGYQRLLDLHPTAKRLMSKIQDIYYLKKSIPADQFPIAVAAVMLDREYPYDVEITEEELL